MALLEWKPEYSVGNPAIDYEHEHMIRQINLLYEKLGDPLDTEIVEVVLGEIHANISSHFALEERLMREINYIEYEDHKDDHEELLDQIHELMDSFDSDPESGQDLLKTRMSDWFGHHFSSFDARLHHNLS
jgi:hemerythrin